MFSTKHLLAFVTLAEHMHFGRAAKALGISKSSLSEQIRLLEEEVGAPLIDRSNRTTSLTRVGEAFLPDARGILAAMDAAKRRCEAILSNSAGTLRFGVDPSSITSGLFSRISEAAKERFPGLTLQITEGSPAKLKHELSERHIDCMLSVQLGIESEDPLTGFPITAWHAVLLAAKRFDVADGHGGIRRQALEGIPYCLFVDGVATPHRISSLYGFHTTRTIALPSLHLMLDYVNSGSAYTVVPEPDAGMRGSETQAVTMPGVMLEVRMQRLAGSAPPLLTDFMGLVRELFPETAYRESAERILGHPPAN